MDPTIICSLIAAVATVVVAVVGVKVNKSNAEVKRSNDEMKERAELRKRESLLSLRMMDATLQLSIVCSNALTGGHNNGNVEKARKAAEKAAKEFDAFMQELTADAIGQ